MGLEEAKIKQENIRFALGSFLFLPKTHGKPAGSAEVVKSGFLAAHSWAYRVNTQMFCSVHFLATLFITLLGTTETGVSY